MASSTESKDKCTCVPCAACLKQKKQAETDPKQASDHMSDLKQADEKDPDAERKALFHGIFFFTTVSVLL